MHQAGGRVRRQKEGETLFMRPEEEKGQAGTCGMRMAIFAEQRPAETDVRFDRTKRENPMW